MKTIYREVADTLKAINDTREALHEFYGETDAPMIKLASIKEYVLNLNKWYEYRGNRINELNDQLTEATKKESDYICRMSEAEDEIEELELEIMKLKAKMYDLLTADNK